MTGHTHSSGLEPLTLSLQEAARYVGDLRVSRNSVTIRGAGIHASTIDGDLIVDGNNFRIRDVTITGVVRIDGNNADLRGARILGAIASFGNNNRW